MNGSGATHPFLLYERIGIRLNANDKIDGNGVRKVG